MKKQLGVMWVGLSLLGLLGCSTPVAKSPQPITESMTIHAARPTSPGPDADQRDTAIYIVNLRGWGNAMAIQLDAIRDLITKDQKK